ncbi:MAG: hypothetical protein LBP36_01555 [Oscillospiraceae bacterium]|jgi:hypothetical protein|nr:hypothetical protein [Oscillospiraceae bacterium]
MCCSSCCENSNSISGVFTQNIPVTLAYNFTPVNVGNNGASSLNGSVLPYAYGGSPLADSLLARDYSSAAAVDSLFARNYSSAAAEALAGIPTRRRPCVSCCCE